MPSFLWSLRASCSCSPGASSSIWAIKSATLVSVSSQWKAVCSRARSSMSISLSQCGDGRQGTFSVSALSAPASPATFSASTLYA